MKTRIIYLVFVLVCYIGFCKQVCYGADSDLASDPVATVNPQEIDLGDYQTEMTVGDKQLLSVTVIPSDATNAKITYQTSNNSVASINGLGRISAIATGDTTITVSCNNIVQSFVLHVKSKVLSTTKKVTEIDLGEYNTEMAVGDRQLLSVTVMPVDATITTVNYRSSNQSIASINSMGRITAFSVGSTTITASCDGITQSFILTIKPKSEVTDIDVGNYEKEMEVDKTQTLSASVLPKDAKDTAVTYESSNSKIATVSSAGEIKALKKGKVKIILKAGKVKKVISIKVKVATKIIEVNSSCLVLKPGEKFSLKASVSPTKAKQALTFQSMDSSIASVSVDGNVEAKKVGNTSIVISNGDLENSVTVIVNESSDISKNKNNSKNNKSSSQSVNLSVDAKNQSIISKEELRSLYESGKTLTINGDNYIITLVGNDIVNLENELQTVISFVKEDNGIGFVINQQNNLPGKISVQLKDSEHFNYLYLYNESKGTYQLVGNNLQNNELSIDLAGKYLLTVKKLSNLKMNVIVIIIISSALFVLITVYVFIRKRYWLW